MKLKEIFSSLLSCALIISVIPFNTYGANIELQNTGLRHIGHIKKQVILEKNNQ